MIDNVEKEKILDAIEALNEFDQESLNQLELYSFDQNSIIRYRVAELLVFADPSFSDPLLLRLLEDPDELVRVNAADSLCNSNSLEVVNALKRHAVEDTWLVRGYCVLSIADIRRNISGSEAENLDFLKTSLRKERNPWVRVSYYKELYELGDASCLRKLIAALNNKSYHVRIIAVKSLAEITHNENRLRIKEALNAMLLIEDTYSVIDCINKSIADIELAEG